MDSSLCVQVMAGNSVLQGVVCFGEVVWILQAGFVQVLS